MNYDFDSILQRLKQALEGQVSAMEARSPEISCRRWLPNWLASGVRRLIR